MKFKLGCHLEYEIAEDTVFIFNIEVAHISRHEGLRENVVFSPNAACQSYTSPELGNRYLRVFAPPGRLSIDYEADLDLDVLRTDPGTLPEVSIGEIPLELLPYLLPTRFVPSDRLAAFAQTEFGESSSGHERVGAICNWIYDNIEYQRGSSDEETTAAEIIIRRAGVCRDFAHLGITFCRALGIPARYLTCYAYGLTPGDFHAVFEAYLGDRWWLFDATRQAALDGLVRIGVGRDAAEVAFATLFGQATSSPPLVWIDRVDGDVEGERTTDAISVEALKDRTP
jgi:transglutaminase-like putative cysteine protease